VEPLLRLMEQYFRTLRELVLEADLDDIGRQVVGEVAGREAAEDVRVGIDEIAEDLWKQMIGQFQSHNPDIRIRVVSEHYPEGYEGGEEPTVLCFLDPFDGSDEWLKRIESSWYSVMTLSTPDGKQPLAAGMLDILAGKIYLISQDSEEYEPGKKKVTVIVIGKRQKVTTGRPDPRTKIPSREPAVIAAYMGRSKYLRPLVEMLERLLPPEETRKKNYRQLTWHGKGGSFVYAWLAVGKLILYIMPNEPTSEILPGWGFASLAGLSLLVKDNGGWHEFNPAVHGKQERVPALIAACTAGMAQDAMKLLT
jgi:hypothetical protein